MFSPHFSNIRRASTTIYSVGKGRFLIIERIDFSSELYIYNDVCVKGAYNCLCELTLLAVSGADSVFPWRTGLRDGSPR